MTNSRRYLPGLLAVLVVVLQPACNSDQSNAKPQSDAGAMRDSNQVADTQAAPDLAAQADTKVSPDLGRDSGPDTRAQTETSTPRADGAPDARAGSPEVQPDAVGPGKDATPAPDGQTPTDLGGGTAAVQLVGRFDTSDPQAASFGWSGSAMIARFDGTGVQIGLDGSPNQFAVVVDGTVLSTLKTTSSGKSYTLASGLSAGTHDLVLYRRTEGNQGENRYLSLSVTGGQLLAPPARPDRRIEVYGDSISAGYGIEGKSKDCSFSQDTENAYITYAAIAARNLGADLHAIVWSGIGMYRNYGDTGASSDAMPAVYARTLPNVSSSSWSFATWQPHAVVINLGTNDASTNGDPGTPYREAYLTFVRNLRQQYPSTFFVLTIGPMLSGDRLSAIKGHIQAVIQTRASEGDTSMSFLEFPTQTDADGYGCDWHPSIAKHAKMADQLTAELKNRLGW